MPRDANVGEKFARLVEIMEQLRGENGCPWDRKQTHESLRQYLLEETYEVLESIDEGEAAALKEELGDLLLQIVFHAQIASESQRFNMSDVIEAISAKLIRRHPNVFGQAEIHTAEEQAINWEKLKREEGKSSVLDGVPKALSGLLRALRIQQKAAAVGFDWPQAEPVWQKIAEEIEELREVADQESHERLEEEFGDLLFSLVNVSRFLGVNPEDALRKTTEKFIRRFQEIEKEYRANQRELTEASLEELDEAWERAKRGERKG